MAERRSIDQTFRLVQGALTPSDAQRDRVRAGLGARADFVDPTKSGVAGDGAGSAFGGTVSAGTVSAGTVSGIGLARAAADRATTADNATTARAERLARTPGSGRSAGLAKIGAWIGLGIAIGYWFGEARSLAPDAASPSAAPARAASADRMLESASEPATRSEPGTAREVGDGGLDAPAASLEAPSRVERRPPRKTRRSHAAGDTHDTSLAELGLLRRAERALRAGDAALARSFIRELDARFSTTVLREERDALQVLADCALSEPAAPAAAREFLRRNPTSVYSDRVGARCNLETSQTTADEAPRLGH